MKTIFTLAIFLQLITGNFMSAQCTSTSTSYDLIVNSTVVIPPGGPSFTMGIVCNGGNLYDSASCCTRIVHVNTGGIYQAGPMAYGMVYLKSGATFDAHGNNNFFNVFHEASSVILNYTGQTTLCAGVYFDTTACLTTNIPENQFTPTTVVYADPASELLTIESSSDLTGVLFTVYDISGKKILEQALTQSGKNQIGISAFAAGLYTYTISGNGTTTANGKFAVAR